MRKLFMHLLGRQVLRLLTEHYLDYFGPRALQPGYSTFIQLDPWRGGRFHSLVPPELHCTDAGRIRQPALPPGAAGRTTARLFDQRRRAEAADAQRVVLVLQLQQSRGVEDHDLVDLVQVEVTVAVLRVVGRREFGQLETQLPDLRLAGDVDQRVVLAAARLLARHHEPGGFGRSRLEQQPVHAGERPPRDPPGEA